MPRNIAVTHNGESQDTIRACGERSASLDAVERLDHCLRVRSSWAGIIADALADGGNAASVDSFIQHYVAARDEHIEAQLAYFGEVINP